MQKLNFEDISEVLASLPDALKKQKLSILLPVYNESAFIAKNILFIAETLRSWGWNFEIVASNDGSKDASWLEILSVQKEVPELVPVNSPRNFGKGRALASAFEASSGAYILFLDSDLELPLEHLPYFFRQMIQDSADIIIGSKKDPRSDLFYPASRRLFSTAYFMGVKILFGLPVQDTQTGIKLFKREALEGTLPYLLVKRFAFDIELLVLCHSRGAKISSHPVVVRYIRDGIGRMGFQTILHMFKDTLAVFWRLRTRLWKNIPLGKSCLRYALVSLGGAQSYMGQKFTVNSLDEVPALMPQLEGFDILVFLKEGEEIAPFMESSLNRLFFNPDIQATVPLLYNKHEQGSGAKNYYILANVFYPIGAYARFRPVRPHSLKTSFPLSSCAVRLPYLKSLLAGHGSQPIGALRVPRPYCSPFFFIQKEFNRADWEFIHKNERALDGYKKAANFFSALFILFPAAICSIWLFRGALEADWQLLPLQKDTATALLLSALFAASLWALLECSLFFWFNFSLGIRRGIPCYFAFCRQRLRCFFRLC